jgi:shikimate kinase
MSTPAPHRENIVLIGFMGCGKSTVGRELHQRLGYPLSDMDQIIEERAGMAISEIFETRGEPAFRDMESALLAELAEDSGSGRIISTGGGVVGRAENREIIRHLGYVVWLDAPPKVILDRTRRNRARPLLQTENPEDRIRELLEERRPLYQEVADLRLDTSGLDSGELATGILESARYHFSRQP